MMPIGVAVILIFLFLSFCPSMFVTTIGTLLVMGVFEGLPVPKPGKSHENWDKLVTRSRREVVDFCKE